MNDFFLTLIERKDQLFTATYEHMAISLLALFIACVIALKYMQAGILYVLWAGVGAIATAFLAKAMLNQSLDIGAWIGLGFISIGLAIIAQFSSIDI